MTIEGNWITGAMNSDYPTVKYKVVELPAGPAGKGTLQFTNCWGVAADSDNKEGAVSLVEYLTTPEQQLAFADAFGVMPSVEEAADEWKQKFPEDAAFIEEADYAQNLPTQEGAADVIADLNAKLAFLNSKGEGGIEKLPAREDPRIRGELVERAHDIGVKYGEIQAKADGLIDVGFENPIRIGGFDQGFDDVMHKGANLDSGDVYIVEYKGGTARLAPGQMEFDWVVGNIRRLYTEGGTVGQSWARVLAKALREGRLKGVAYSTPISGGSPLPTDKVGTWTYKPTRIVF